MWPNNGFNGNGSFQHGQDGLPQGQGSFQRSRREDGYIPFSPMLANQQHLQQQMPAHAMQQSRSPSSNEQYFPNEFQPEVSLYDEGALMHNHYLGADGPVSTTMIGEGSPS